MSEQIQELQNLNFRHNQLASVFSDLESKDTLA